MQNNNIFDEKVFSILQKIEIPKNPFSFYFNLSKIEKNLSEWLRDYFYKAINEFLYHNNNQKSFLLKVYYYTGFIEKLAFGISNLLKDVKYYDLNFYLTCANIFDENIKLKACIFNTYYYNDKKIKELFEKTKNEFEAMNILQDKKIWFLYNKKEESLIFKEFEEKFYNLDYKKKKELIDFIYENIDVNILKYPLSYEKTKEDYLTFKEKWGEKYRYYKAVNLCLDKIVSYYNKNQVFYKNTLINKIISNIDNLRKNYYIKTLIDKEEIDFKKWQKIFKEKYNNKYFKYDFEFERFFLTYLINKKDYKLKKLFYWEATKNRLSENDWADIWWANIFYLQKIDENIWNFEMLMFFKQFKDTLINLNTSLSWPFIKPYFYYLLIFKSIKLPLKDWQKLFFLLMFFSAESYQEYVILQNIMKSIENIWLWKINIHNSKTLFYLKRFFMFFKEFSSSVILSILLVLWVYALWLINIVMLGVIFLIMVINWLRYIFFPGKFEILRTFVIFSLAILWYIWFTTIFPKITHPQYLNYVWETIHSIVNLDFSWAKENYKKTIKFIYWDKYKENEKILLTNLINKTSWISKNIVNNPDIQNFSKNIKNKVETALTGKAPDIYIRLKKWTYLKYYINKEIDKLNINFKKKKELSKKVVKEYIQWYCFLHDDYYCKTKLEKLPVWFKINLTKIKELIQKNL